MKTEMISILQFSENPAGRYLKDGPNSGERFREEVLVPALSRASDIEINLDGALGFGSSFLEEAFGGLVRRGYSASELLKRIKIRSSVATYNTRIQRYIEEAGARKKKLPA